MPKIKNTIYKFEVIKYGQVQKYHSRQEVCDDYSIPMWLFSKLIKNPDFESDLYESNFLINKIHEPKVRIFKLI